MCSCRCRSWVRATPSGSADASAPSADPAEQAAPADRPRPAPEPPDALALLHRKIDEFGMVKNVGGRHRAVLAEHPAVARIVAVVAHHEIVPGRHGVFRRVVEKAVVDLIENAMAATAGQRFEPLPDRSRL